MTAAIRAEADDPRPCPQTESFDLAVCVGDGVRGLGRVVNVLALLDLTPLELFAITLQGTLEVRATLLAERRAVTLALERLRALPCVRSAQLRPKPGNRP